MTINCSMKLAAVFVLCLLPSFVLADLQAIDVESIIKKEQPDFEDDGGYTIERQPVVQNVEKFIERFSVNSDVAFVHAFVATFCVIIVSELGDKTFFIAAIMAMSHSRITVFSGAMSALALMHVLSALFGYLITVVPRTLTFYLSIITFVIFGVKMLREGWKMSPDEGKQEFEEVQTDLRRREDNFEKEPLEEAGGGTKGRIRGSRLLLFVSRVYLEALILTFLAEWGDRSQIATVIMAAREDITGVIIGGLIGHFLCTGLAVIGGRMIATRISIRTVTLIGGVVFLIFAFSALILGP